MDQNLFPLRKLVWRQFFHQYTTPREWKKGARDIPFGLGAKTLYVDGDNGNDHNDGLSWKTAFKTIQHAIDEADSWTTIFIRSATYQENVSVPSDKSSISLIGESWKGVIIDGGDAASSALTLTSSFNILDNLYFKSSRPFIAACSIDGDKNIIKNCFFENSATNSSFDFRLNGNDNLVTKCETSGDATNACFTLFGKRNEISYSRIYAASAERAILLNDGVDESLIHDCFLMNASLYGISCSVNTNHNFCFHNNFFSNATHIRDGGSNNLFVENYYDNHSNQDNGFGIATEPFTFSSGSDPRPVITRNGWLALGLGTDTIISSAVAGTYSHPDDTSEHDVLEFSAALQDISLALDLSALTQPVEIREYEKIDGTNYRQVSFKSFPQDFDFDTDTVLIYIQQRNKDYKVTLKSTTAEEASKSIPYVYRLSSKE